VDTLSVDTKLLKEVSHDERMAVQQCQIKTKPNILDRNKSELKSRTVHKGSRNRI
jgi:hypothetical protein